MSLRASCEKVPGINEKKNEIVSSRPLVVGKRHSGLGKGMNASIRNQTGL